MEKFYNIITNPAWWGVGVAIITAWITWHRGKKEAKAQEYKLYRELYDIIHNIDWLIGNFLHSLYAKLCKHADVEDIKNELDDMRGCFYKTERELMQRMIDFQLKTSNGRENVLIYQNAIILMANLTSNMYRILHADGVKLNSTDVEKEYRPSMIVSNEIILKSAIVSRIVSQDNAERVEYFIDQFLEAKDKVVELDYANKISKHC